MQIIEDGYGGNNDPIEDITLDADDAWVEFTEDIMQAEDNELGEMYFKEGFNRGVEAMRSQVLTLLETEK